MPWTPPYNKPLSRNILRAVVEAIADEIWALRGYRLTTLDGAHVEGETTLDVRSAHLFGCRTPSFPRMWADAETIFETPSVIFTQDRYGWAVAADGRTLVIGAPETGVGTGRIYVYRWVNGDWSAPKILTASDGAVGDQYGAAVAILGDKILVGAPNDDAGRGSAYLLTEEDADWTETTKLTASDRAAGDLFGTSVSLAISWALVGAPGDDASKGSAYAYSIPGYVEQKLVDPTGGAGDLAGTSVCADGDTALVGSPTGGAVGGSAQVWLATVGVFALQQDLIGDDIAVDAFGTSVFLRDDRAVVGAPTTEQVFVFERSGVVWGSGIELTASDGVLGDGFGHQVAMMGPLVAVSSPHRDGGIGQFYLFPRADDGTWSEGTYRVRPSDAIAAQRPGHSSVCLAEKWLIYGSETIAAGGKFQTYLVELQESGQLIVAGEPDPIGYIAMDRVNARFWGCDPLTGDRRADSEVADWSRRSSKMDELRNALLVGRAEGRDLDAVARCHGKLPRLLSFTDDAYRDVIQAIAYTWRGTIYAIEMALEALYPDGGWEIYESCVEWPGKLFVSTPGELVSDPAGRCYLEQEEDTASTSTTTATVTDDPITVRSVALVPVSQTLPMNQLPSLDGWTFVAESVGIEAAYFAIAGGQLQHTHPAGTDSGRYERTIPQISNDYYTAFEIAWKADTLTVVGGYPWKIVLRDGEYEYCLMWSDTDVLLGQSDETPVSGPVTITGLATGWHVFRLEHGQADHYVRAYVDGVLIFFENETLFAASADHLLSFGYFDCGNANDYLVYWDESWLYVKNETNFWNLEGTGGSLALGSQIFTDLAGVFVAGDIGRNLWAEAANDENYGLWTAIANPGPTQLTLDGFLHVRGAYADTLRPDRLFSYDDVFSDHDIPKSIIIPTSGVGNDDTYPIVAVITPREVQLDISGHPGGLVTEEDVDWKFDPTLFVNEAAIPWTLVAAGTFVAGALTWRHALPATPVDVRVNYTTVLSAIMMRDETVEDETAACAYIYGIDEELQALIDNLTAGGVIPVFAGEV